MNSLKIITLSVLTAASIQLVSAQDRQFARTYQSTVLPKGNFDLEFWNTFRTGRTDFYNRLDQRLEFEYGVTDKFQSAFYFNATHKAAGSNDSIGGIEHESEFSFSHELKWQLANPSTNAMGFGLYAEYTIAASEVELEAKLLLDKKTEKNIFAYNAVGEYEMEWEVEPLGEVEIEKEIKIENDLAYMRMFKPTFGLGLEFRNHNVMVDGEMEHSAIFGGPTLFWSSGTHFVILNILPQWANLKSTSSLDLKEYEKIEIRLLVGFGK